MCGIAGYSGRFTAAELDGMSREIRHRGPDGEGMWTHRDGIAGLAHRRLSIIDLSEAGKQPMQDTSGKVFISYNGEVYNYRQLRTDLESEFSFRSHTDTEVVLNLYLKHGPEFVKRLNGIFAFAIWDERTREMLIARDPFGVKPLYYATTPRGFVFASELKALLTLPDLAREIDCRAVVSYVSYMYSPSPRTMLRAVSKLEPGRMMRIIDGEPQKPVQYYEFPVGTPERHGDALNVAAELREKVDQAVRRQLVSDVPVGAFLSGGLDSSAIVAFARKHYSGDRFQCFTMDIEGDSKENEGLVNDLPFARRVAKHLDVKLNTIEVGADMIGHFSDMVAQLDEPQADPAALNTLFISRLARENGIKVLLSGAGGDDILSGYRRHRAMSLEGWWNWLPRWSRKMLRDATQMLGVAHPTARRISKAFRYSHLEENQRIASYFLWLDPKIVGGLIHAEASADLDNYDPLDPLMQRLAAMPSEVPALNRMLGLDASFFLTDHNLNYTDKMGMAVGVETRVPLLDLDLVEYAATIPVNMKQRGATGKWIFKKAMEGLLPKDVIYRPKAGFGAPVRKWFNDGVRSEIRDVFDSQAFRERGLFDPAAVRELIERNRTGRIDAMYSILAIYCVELWCRRYLDGRP